MIVILCLIGNKVIGDCGKDFVHQLDESSQALINATDATLARTDELLYGCHFKEAIKVAMDLAHEANRYLDKTAPWKVIHEDRKAAADSLYTAIQIISALRTVLYPFLPFSCQKLHEMLGFNGNIEDQGWNLQTVPPGQKLQSPQPLFTKLDEKVADEEYARLRATD